jgi:hypothetical protein
MLSHRPISALIGILGFPSRDLAAGTFVFSPQFDPRRMTRIANSPHLIKTDASLEQQIMINKRTKKPWRA